MTIRELNKEQLEQVKQHYYCENNERVSWGELVYINDLVSDEEIFDAYENVYFTEEDFGWEIGNNG